MPVTTALGSNADLAEEVIESGACPLLAQSGQANYSQQCPLLGVKADIGWRCRDVCF